jgi:hypothetical protein
MMKIKKSCAAATAQDIRSHDTFERISESSTNSITFDSSCKETYEIAGKSYPVVGHAQQPGYGRMPIVNVPMMSDYKWQLMALESRLEHPERYAEHFGEDIPAVIERLKVWLLDHIDQAKPEEAERVLQLVKTV